MSTELLEPVSVQALAATTRVDLDMQVATAKAYPRVVAQIQRTVLDVVESSEEIAGMCFYKLPKGGGFQNGPSVRLAELYVNEWGNLRVQTRTVDVGQKTVTAEAVVWDLEKNSKYQCEVTRGIWGERGRYSENLIVTTIQAASAIAFRNAVFKIIPGVFVSEAYELAKKVSIGGATESIVEKAGKSLQAFAKLGVTREMIFEYVGTTDTKEFTNENLVDLRGIYNAIKGGDGKVEDYFIPKKPAPPKGTEEYKAAMAAKNAKNAEAEAEPPADELFPGATSEAEARYGEEG